MQTISAFFSFNMSPAVIMAMPP